ncbi:hypothetical protein GCM10010193_23050 [Kitasatospora atroaurantiaca]|uniref:NACHT domain-containing protein n=1 Tax=Kitasatospora atroaurantiaca TaxID=285545 RepID=A0A561F175_9ACTN|nr:NACHT domain-containing protein [Kitasatospora atroaurantiaca]TWE21606.1 NACHT domain-containing protein [Kitasatospora atroaurantiaca]
MRRASGILRIRITLKNPDLPASGVFRRSWARLRWPFISFGREFRSVWLLTRGVCPEKRWWSPFPRTLGLTFAWLLALGLVFWFVKAAVAVFGPGDLIWPTWPWSFAPDRSCTSSSYSCGVLTSTVLPVLTLALTTVFFIVWRFRSVRSFYMRKAKHEPRVLVETAGSIMGHVVGRDQLCKALMDNMRDGTARRPHVVVGAIGTGKTALVVRLTEMLARKGAFPVPIRLRDAQKDLDFLDLAYARFSSVVESKTRSAAETEKVWRLLRRHDKIVVLADGLEEALSGKSMVADRDNKIRKAIRAAGEARLPLVITSRPHDPLRAMEAAVTELEPLSEDAALEYIAENGNWRASRQDLDRIIEIANVTESPLYLQIAKDLHHRNLLKQIWIGGDDGGGNVVDQNMWEMKFDLLEAWVEALIGRELYSELPLSRDDRRVVMEYLKALACIGLKCDSAAVSFDELEPGSNPAIFKRLEGKRKGSAIDVRLAATWGTRMGIVEEAGEYVRFQHSIMQAYLGSQYLGAVLNRHDQADAPPGWESTSSAGDYFPAALQNPGREMLISLVFHSRSLKEKAQCTCLTPGQPDPRCPIRVIRNLLLDEADQALLQDGRIRQEGGCPEVGREVRTPHAKVLDMYGAALDVDSVDTQPDPRAIAESLHGQWNKLQERDPQRLRAAKLSLVRRLGAASRRAALNGGEPAYDLLFAFALEEPVYRVRIAIAQEIGAGGDKAFLALRGELGAPTSTVTGEGARNSNTETAAEPVPGLVTGQGGERERRKQERAVAAERLQGEWDLEEGECLTERSLWNRNTMSARLIPMLVDSVSMAHHLGTPYDNLGTWLSTLASAPGGEELPDPVGRRGLEVAMAHGFKHSANRRLRQSSQRESRDFLIAQATEMLKANRFWFTRLTLLQALTLWALPDDITEERLPHGPGAHPKELVRRWLELPSHESEHPFVEAAEKLAVRALETRHPERFLWMDEACVASQVGSEPGWAGEPRRHNLWIPPSTGWSTLDPAAQQLLADVIMLMTLTERADRPRELFRRLALADASPSRLPPCLTHDRTTLDPTRTTAHAMSTPSKSNCADNCPFTFCPSPPKIPDLRVELSEVFCMNQHALLGRWQPRAWSQLRFRRKARWQRKTSAMELRQFWGQMGARARDMPRQEVTPARHRPRR